VSLFICPKGLIDRVEIRLAVNRGVERCVFMEFRGRENQIMAGIIIGPAGVPLCPHCNFAGSYTLTTLPYLKSFPSSLSDLSNRREQGGKASSDFLDFEAHSGSMQRKSREI
jgi:hypothetical protein